MNGPSSRLLLLAGAGVAVLLSPCVQSGAQEKSVPLVQPWRRITLDAEFGGAWVVAGDLDGDGTVEIVSARNVDQNDVHFTSSVVAQRLDSSILWRWGSATIGRKELHHDVACQIHDWDGDGRNEVVLCAGESLLELDGVTGREKRRLALPAKGASDCLVFADLSGKARASDVLVKDRYNQIWAFNHEWKQLWTVRNPGGYKTAHQAVPVDLDGDGRDEVMAGYAMLNADGSIRWTFKSQKVDQGLGHCDCFRVVRSGRKAEDFRFVMTLCGANCIAFLDGTGQSLWEIAGHHFESVDVGRICAGERGLQFAVDIDHRPKGEGPVWIIDESGQLKREIKADWVRFHTLVDWTGDGLDEVVLAQARALFDGRGRIIARLAMDPADDTDSGGIVMTGDFTGDGVPDLMLTTKRMTHVYIYKNEHGHRPSPPAPLGTGPNFTLY